MRKHTTFFFSCSRIVFPWITPKSPSSHHFCSLSPAHSDCDFVLSSSRRVSLLFSLYRRNIPIPRFVFPFGLRSFKPHDITTTRHDTTRHGQSGRNVCSLSANWDLTKEPPTLSGRAPTRLLLVQRAAGWLVSQSRTTPSRYNGTESPTSTSQMHVQQSLSMVSLHEIASVLQSRMTELHGVTDSYSWATRLISWFFVRPIHTHLRSMSVSTPMFLLLLPILIHEHVTIPIDHPWTVLLPPHCRPNRLRLRSVDLATSRSYQSSPKRPTKTRVPKSPGQYVLGKYLAVTTTGADERHLFFVLGFGLAGFIKNGGVRYI